MSMPRTGSATVAAPKKSPLTDKAIEEALQTCGGWHTLTAAKLGYSRSYISERINANERLKKLQYEVEEEMLDKAEQALQFHILEEKNLTALIFYLKTKGRRRGYSEYQETNQSIEVARQLIEEIKRLKVENLT